MTDAHELADETQRDEDLFAEFASGSLATKAERSFTETKLPIGGLIKNNSHWELTGDWSLKQSIVQQRIAKREELQLLADTASGKFESKQELITEKTKLLTAIFAKRKVKFDHEDKNSKSTFDLLEWVYWNWVEYWVCEDVSTMLTQQKTQTVYGSQGLFIWQDQVEEAVQSIEQHIAEVLAITQVIKTQGGLETSSELGELNNSKISLTKNQREGVDVRTFKKAVFETIVRASSLQDSVIAVADVNEFVKVMAHNKIRTDRDVKEQLWTVLSYCDDLSGNSEISLEKDLSKQIILLASWEQVSREVYEYLAICRKEEYDTQIDSLTETGKTWRELREWFCKIELAGWKKLTHQKYHKYINKYWRKRLMRLKGSFVDKFGDPFRPQGWQCDILLCPERYIYVAASRRSGKTYLATYLASRQIYLPWQYVMYIIPTKENHSEQPRRYFVSGLWNDPNMQILESSLEIKHKFEQLGEWMTSVMKMYTDKKTAVRSQTCNLVVYDEMAFLDEDTCDAARPTIATEKGYIYGISTVDPDTPKNHFYYDLIDAEIEQMAVGANKRWLRVTLLDNPFIDDDEKQQIIQNWMRKPAKFRAEWMADFQESSTFDLSRFWRIDYEPVRVPFWDKWIWAVPAHVALKTKENDPYKQYFIIHDAWKRKDQPWLAVLWLTVASGWPKVEIVLSWYLEGLDYYDQCEVLSQALKFFGKDKSQVYIELNENWQAVEEILIREHKIYPTTVWITGWFTEKVDGRAYTLGKTTVMTKLKLGIGWGIMTASSFMTHLRKELETYSDDATENDKRKGGHHFDIISALRIWAYFADRYWYFDGENTEIDMGDWWIKSFVEMELRILGGDKRKDNNVNVQRMAQFGY